MQRPTHPGDRLAGLTISALGHGGLLLVMSILGIHWFLRLPEVSGRRTVTTLNAVFSPASTEPTTAEDLPLVETPRPQPTAEPLKSPARLELPQGPTEPEVVAFRPMVLEEPLPPRAESVTAKLHSPLHLARSNNADQPPPPAALDFSPSSHPKIDLKHSAPPQRAELQPQPQAAARRVVKRTTRNNVELPSAQASAASVAVQQAGNEQTPARPLFNPPPPYPAAAIGAGLQGRAVLQLRIEQDGRVSEVNVVQSTGHTVLDRAASGAVAKWRFHPAQQDGRSVTVTVLQPILFRL